MSFSSQIPIYQFIPQQAHIHVSQPLQAAISSQHISSVSSIPWVPLTQPLQGTLQSQSLGQGIPKIPVGQALYNMAQPQSNPPYARMMQNLVGQ